MNSRNSLKILFYLLSCTLWAQEDLKKVIALDSVVVSAQIEPQSVRKSVKNVQVISKTQIQKMGAVNLADVLNQYINITVRPDINTGKQTVSFLGLGGNYFKVLVDNIPLVSENGFGNNTDLSQVNLEDVERIEIVEGAMGVTHGANAVTGILNIITKKKSRLPWEIGYTLQEESIGQEYNFLNKGRHIQSFKASHSFNDNWYVSVGTQRNKYSGFWSDYKGKNYSRTDGKRGYKTSPFETLQSNALLSYRKDRFNLLYKAEYMNERFDFYDRTAEFVFSPIYGGYRFGNDRRDFYQRYFHHLNLNGQYSQWFYNFSFSYQYQKREEENFRYMIDFQKEINNQKRKTHSMKVFYSTGSVSHSFANKKYNWQLGYELTHNIGFSLLNDEGQTLKKVEKEIDNYDIYSVLEVNLSDRLSLRPGGRFSYQNLFRNQYAYSLGSRYSFDNHWEWRASVGESYRTPSFEELYTRSIFMGHAFLGNENLLPERGISAETSLKKTSLWDEEGMLVNNLGISFNNIKDKIHNVLLDMNNGTPHTQYINISRYQSYNCLISNNLKLSQWEITLGGSFAWISQKIDNQRYRTDDRYLLNINANTGVSYTIKKWDTSISAYYKFIGKSQMWQMSSTGYVIGDLDPYGWLDISLQKKFFNRKIELTLGARNLLNTIDVGLYRQTLSGEKTRLNYPIGYGRSYFLKLTYNLNINY
jgi:putative tonB-dependent outer membrane receptor